MERCATAVHARASQDPVLSAAAELFYARGISDVSVQDIRARAGTSLKAMYARYPSKEHLVAAYLRETHEAWMRDLRAAIAPAATRTARIEAVFAWLEAWFSALDFAGCGIANTRGQALGEQARAVVREHVEELQELCTEAAGDAGTGRVLFVLIEGAIAAAAATGDPGMAAPARRAALAAVS